MGFSRRWRIATRERLHQVLGSLSHTLVSEKSPLVLTLASEKVPKTAEQRALFHAICSDISKIMGLTPADVKVKIKASFYGAEVFIVRMRTGHEVLWADVPSSEDSDREEYSRLIDHAYQWAAEGDVVIPDRRTR